jgi:hypothetical protein
LPDKSGISRSGRKLGGKIRAKTAPIALVSEVVVVMKGAWTYVALFFNGIGAETAE